MKCILQENIFNPKTLKGTWVYEQRNKNLKDLKGYIFIHRKKTSNHLSNKDLKDPIT